MGRRDGGVVSRMGDAIDEALGELRDRRVQTLLLFSRGEPLAEDVAADGRLDRLEEWPNLRLEEIPTEDHLFRPVWAQRRVNDAFDAALMRALREGRQRSSAE